MTYICKDLNVGRALKAKQRGFLLNPHRFGAPSVPTDPYFANVSLLLLGEGADNSTVITDNSPAPKSVSVAGGAKISTAQSKFGSSSIYFNGTGAYLNAGGSADYIFGTGDFTVEMWVYLLTSSGTQALIGFANGSAANSNYSYQLACNGSPYAFIAVNASTVYGTAGSGVSVGSWRHLAVVRSGSNIKLFDNGSLISTDSLGSIGVRTLNSPAGAVLHIGRVQGYYPTNGYIDSVRITKGVARYSSAFSVPTAAFPTS